MASYVLSLKCHPIVCRYLINSVLLFTERFPIFYIFYRCSQYLLSLIGEYPGVSCYVSAYVSAVLLAPISQNEELLLFYWRCIVLVFFYWYWLLLLVTGYWVLDILEMHIGYMVRDKLYKKVNKQKREIKVYCS